MFQHPLSADESGRPTCRAYLPAVQLAARVCLLRDYDPVRLAFLAHCHTAVRAAHASLCADQLLTVPRPPEPLIVIPLVQSFEGLFVTASGKNVNLSKEQLERQAPAGCQKAHEFFA